MPGELTLESLRKDNAALVSAIETEARKGYVAQAEKDRAVNDAKESVVRNLKSDTKVLENVGLVTFEARDAAIAEARKVGAAEGRQAATDEFTRGDTIRTAIASAEKPLTAKIAALELEKKETDRKLFEKTADDRRNARLKVIKDMTDQPKFASYRTVLRTMLEQLPESVELVNAEGKETESVTTKVKEAEQVWTAMGKPKGMGKVVTSGASQRDGEEPKSKDEVSEGAVSPHAALSGM